MEMGENMIISTNTAIIMSAGTVTVGAICALLTFLFSRQISRRDRVDFLKIEILRAASSVQGKELWITTLHKYLTYTGNRSAPTANTRAGLLGRNHKKKEWVLLILVAIEELKREGYQNLLGL